MPGSPAPATTHRHGRRDTVFAPTRSPGSSRRWPTRRSARSAATPRSSTASACSTLAAHRVRRRVQPLGVAIHAFRLDREGLRVLCVPLSCRSSPFVSCDGSWWSSHCSALVSTSHRNGARADRPRARRSRPARRRSRAVVDANRRPVDHPKIRHAMMLISSTLARVARGLPRSIRRSRAARPRRPAPRMPRASAAQSADHAEAYSIKVTGPPSSRRRVSQVVVCRPRCPRSFRSCSQADDRGSCLREMRQRCSGPRVDGAAVAPLRLESAFVSLQIAWRR